MKLTTLTTVVTLVLAAVPSSGQELERVPKDIIQPIAAVLLDEVAKLESLAVRVEPDIKQVNGWRVPDELGFMVVPQQGLKESEDLAAKFKEPQGVVLGYLLMHQVSPVKNGSQLDPDTLPAIELDADGEKKRVMVLTLTAKQLGDDDYRLYAFGSTKTPLIDSDFQLADETAEETVSVSVTDVDGSSGQGTIVITVFGKYQASFRAGKID